MYNIFSSTLPKISDQLRIKYQLKNYLSQANFFSSIRYGAL